MPNALYIEPYSGIAGDMFAAAMSELVPDINILFEGLNSLPINNEFKVHLNDTSKNSIKAKSFQVETIHDKAHHHHGRTLSEITAIINAGNKITQSAKDIAINIFNKLAEAEAAVHGTSSEIVHFHEVGAIDAIVDITSSAILLDAIGKATIISSPVSLGQGTVKCAHGIIPVPSPATMELLKGVPVNYTTINTELTTPTGAAILTAVTNKWNAKLTGTIINTGYGAGNKDIDGLSNLLRISLFSLEDEHIGNDEEIVVIECNLDDYPAEHLSFLGPHLLKEGALDFAVIPATVKKGRQGMILQVISPQEKASRLFRVLLKETSTLGIRYRKEKRIILAREFHTIDTPIGKIKIKAAIDNNGKIIKAKPEQSVVEKISKQQNKCYFETYKLLDYYTQQWLLTVK